MPILEVEFIGAVSREIRSGLAQRIADAAAAAFDSAPQGTWVKLRFLDEKSYAENSAVRPSTAQPVFVSVTQSSLPAEPERSEQASVLSNAIADLSDRPVENVHILFEPPAAGRIFFGGRLRS